MITNKQNPQIGYAQLLLPGERFEETLKFFREQLAFRLDMITPADSPEIADLSGHGLRLRLDRNYKGAAATIRLLVEDFDGDGSKSVIAPNGTRIEFTPACPPLEIPDLKPTLSVSTCKDGARWEPGRAGMLYRDLISDRQGGRLIASHIQIPEGGPVPDDVHFHDVMFQMIYCYKGWVRLVYEDQGDPLYMKAGDCVLQPPKIRHRVLECSDGLEVVEIGCPAKHPTYLDHEMALPTGKTLPNRDFGGQKFVFHQAEKAVWENWHLPGFEARDLGIQAATNGLANVAVARSLKNFKGEMRFHTGDFLFGFILSGEASATFTDQFEKRLGPSDSIVIPAGMAHCWHSATDDFEILEISMPGESIGT